MIPFFCQWTGGFWRKKIVADCFLHSNVGNYTVIAWKSINPSFRCLTRLLDQTSSGTSWKPCKTSPQTHHNTCTLLSWMKNTTRDGGSTALLTPLTLLTLLIWFPLLTWFTLLTLVSGDSHWQERFLPLLYITWSSQTWAGRSWADSSPPTCPRRHP